MSWKGNYNFKKSMKISLLHKKKLKVKNLVRKWDPGAVTASLDFVIMRYKDQDTFHRLINLLAARDTSTCSKLIASVPENGSRFPGSRKVEKRKYKLTWYTKETNDGGRWNIVDNTYNRDAWSRFTNKLRVFRCELWPSIPV